VFGVVVVCDACYFICLLVGVVDDDDEIICNSYRTPGTERYPLKIWKKDCELWRA